MQITCMHTDRTWRTRIKVVLVKLSTSLNKPLKNDLDVAIFNRQEMICLRSDKRLKGVEYIVYK